MSILTKLTLATVIFAGAIGVAQAAEYPIGHPQKPAGTGLEVAAVYLQPVTMEPKGMMLDAAKSDIHLEADIHAIADNPNGYAEGDWASNLVIQYELRKAGSAKVIKGDLMPMVANDGPHYGDNVKLDGPGKYTLKLMIAPPTADPHSHFGRHVDKETGVKDWWKPFEASFDFAFAGIGKKGGY
ncbi:MAG: rane protein [Herbaspirillum sp.]|nr:rane protein [Herbaspirillum sp.]